MQGQLSLSGFQPGQLRGQYFGVARLGYYYHLFGNFYTGGWIETGNVWQSSDDLGDDLIGASTLFLGAETLAGPLYVAYGVAEGKRVIAGWARLLRDGLDEIHGKKK